MDSFGIESFSAWLSHSTGIRQSRDIYEFYEFNQHAGVLGLGSYGQVVQARSKATGVNCAIKQISKTMNDDDKARAMNLRDTKAVRQEIEIMQSLNHQNIVKLVDNFEDNFRFYLAMELCAGGRVIDFIARTQVYSESDVAVLMRQVFDAIDYMHGKDIVHRDVKPDNMLLESCRPLAQNTLKLIDFGISCKCSSGQELRLRAGTPEYMSPQVIDGRYDARADLWSCGVVMYSLLCGYVPFRGQSESGIFTAVRRGNFTWPEKDWQRTSDESKDLIRGLLKLDARERLTAQEALGHSWTRNATAFGRATQLESTLRHFKSHSANRKRPVEEADSFANVRAAWNEISRWADGLLPQAKSEGAAAQKIIKQIVVM